MFDTRRPDRQSALTLMEGGMATRQMPQSPLSSLLLSLPLERNRWHGNGG